MSTYNTYIGARYVPLLVGDWDTTKQTEYEPLTVVQYRGNSYTSRTYVPKNIDITNTEYWVVTGNYNAQIEAYRKEVDRNTATTQDLIKTVNSKRSFILCGDSLGDGYSSKEGEGNTNMGWCTRAREDLRSAGIMAYNFSDVSTPSRAYGSCFGNSAWHDLISAINDDEKINNADITDIVVFGGSNELNYTDEQIRAAISLFMKDAIRWFPHATIKVGIVACCFDRFDNELNVPAIYKSEVPKYGGQYVNASFYLFRLNTTEYLNDDNTHPTLAGYNFFYPMVLELITNNSATFSYGRITEADIANNTLFNGVRFFIRCTNDGIYLKVCDENAHQKMTFATYTLPEGTANVNLNIPTPITLSKGSEFSPVERIDKYIFRIDGLMTYNTLRTPTFSFYVICNDISSGSLEPVTSLANYITWKYDWMKIV